MNLLSLRRQCRQRRSKLLSNTRTSVRSIRYCLATKKKRKSQVKYVRGRRRGAARQTVKKKKEKRFKRYNATQRNREVEKAMKVLLLFIMHNFKQLQRFENKLKRVYRCERVVISHTLFQRQYFYKATVLHINTSYRERCFLGPFVCAAPPSHQET